MNHETYSLEIKQHRMTTVKVISPDASAVTSGIIFSHGLNNDLDLPLLVRVAEVMAERGRAATRFNFLYREAGKRNADSKEDLETCLVEVYENVLDKWNLSSDRTVLAGKSLGARVNAAAVRDGLHIGAIIHLGFPLQVPAQPQNNRADLLLEVDPAPQLFFAGSRDPLCPLAPLKTVLKKLKGPNRLHVIDGGDHSFRLPKADPRTEEDILNEIARTAADWLDEMDL